MPSSSCKQKSSAAPTKETLWSPIKVSSSFVPLFEMQRRREFLKGDIERKERQLNTTRYMLKTVEDHLEALEKQPIEKAGKPTGKVLNVFVHRGTSQLEVSSRFLSGNLNRNVEFTVYLPFDASVGDLQSHVHRNAKWAASVCIDHEPKEIPSHAGLQDCVRFIMKEVELMEVSSQDQCWICYRRSEAIDFLKEVKLPIRYEQEERW